MGFGLLLLGYMTVIGLFPDFLAISMYIGYAFLVNIIGGFLILLAFRKLQEFNIYFKIMQYISVLYILVLLVFTPFIIIGETGEQFVFISRIVRIFLLFLLHYFMLTGIKNLADSIANIKIYRSSKFNIYLTYLYFGLSIIGIFNLGEYQNYIMMAVLMLGLMYFIRNMLCIYQCYLYITYEGHDEEQEIKIEQKKEQKTNKKNKK